jgi:hypothetical protein
MKLKNERIMKVLRDKHLSIRKLATLCNWHYQNLDNFLSFKSIPRSENKESLVKVLQNLDPTISQDDIFLVSKGITKLFKDLPEMTSEERDELGFDELQLEIENADKSIEDEIDLHDFFKRLESNKILTPIQVQVLKLYYGIGCSEHALDEIAQILKKTSERVRQIKDKAGRIIAHNQYLKRIATSILTSN